MACGAVLLRQLCTSLPFAVLSNWTGNELFCVFLLRLLMAEDRVFSPTPTPPPSPFFSNYTHVLVKFCMCIMQKGKRKIRGKGLCANVFLLPIEFVTFSHSLPHLFYSLHTHTQARKPLRTCMYSHTHTHNLNLSLSLSLMQLHMAQACAHTHYFSLFFSHTHTQSESEV